MIASELESASPPPASYMATSGLECHDCKGPCSHPSMCYLVILLPSVLSGHRQNSSQTSPPNSLPSGEGRLLDVVLQQLVVVYVLGEWLTPLRPSLGLLQEAHYSSMALALGSHEL